MKIQSAENFGCPSCGELFSEDALMQICGDPFNGTVLNCNGCQKEWSVDIKLEVRELN